MLGWQLHPPPFSFGFTCTSLQRPGLNQPADSIQIHTSCMIQTAQAAPEKLLNLISSLSTLTKCSINTCHGAKHTGSCKLLISPSTGASKRATDQSQFFSEELYRTGSEIERERCVKDRSRWVFTNRLRHKCKRESKREAVKGHGKEETEVFSILDTKGAKRTE